MTGVKFQHTKRCYILQKFALFLHLFCVSWHFLYIFLGNVVAGISNLKSEGYLVMTTRLKRNSDFNGGTYVRSSDIQDLLG